MSSTEKFNSQSEWLINDPLLKNEEVDIHDRLHAKIANAGISKTKILSNPRLKLLEKIELRFGLTLGGKVLDVGCGSGYFSAWLALNRDVEVVYALESSPAAVNTLIPKTLEVCEVKRELVVPVLGSFNRIPKVEYFDYVVALGALHHSADLFITLKEIYNALKPGGYLIAQEPTIDDLTNNQRLREIYLNRAEHNDHFFRNCEYKTALNFVGFEIICYDHFDSFVGLRDAGFRQILAKTHGGMKRLIAGGDDGKNKTRVDAERRVILARKPAVSVESPHVWKLLLR